MAIGPLTFAIAQHAREATKDWPASATIPDVELLLRTLAKWRAQIIAKTYLTHHGPIIRGGLFAGMTYLENAEEGSLIARLLGVYEAELHPYLQRFVEDGVDCVIDVGCAEGYYAVGLARRYPHLEVRAHDISEAARTACRQLAERNGVADRVRIGGLFAPEDFEAFADRRPLVLVDAEGAEVDILDPSRSPALARMRIVVETHDVWRKGALQTLRDRFEASHDIVEVHAQAKAFTPPEWLAELSELDLLLATWEWRYRATPWLVMTPRPA